MARRTNVSLCSVMWIMLFMSGVSSNSDYVTVNNEHFDYRQCEEYRSWYVNGANQEDYNVRQLSDRYYYYWYGYDYWYDYYYYWYG
eukprot:CAMPEP_0194492730 /NCGR_PEP_ID=MMETSP0253-20130528/11183_1 /TAXON_ID=2966 /ORGANISM="Noctiluca scintillans" /LENGTH=85 /DNA_ID=CAMNT_0039333633 /DNA_START=73 /DNA_END=327 /DNA_ORIENTATION=+